MVPFRGLGQQTHTFSYICGSIKIRIVVESLMVGLGERVLGASFFIAVLLMTRRDVPLKNHLFLNSANLIHKIRATIFSENF